MTKGVLYRYRLDNALSDLTNFRSVNVSSNQLIYDPSLITWPMVVHFCPQRRVISDGTHCRCMHSLGYVSRGSPGPYPISTAFPQGFSCS